MGILGVGLLKHLICIIFLFEHAVSLPGSSLTAEFCSLFDVQTVSLHFDGISLMNDPLTSRSSEIKKKINPKSVWAN